MSKQAIEISKYFKAKYKINIEVIDVRTLSPLTRNFNKIIQKQKAIVLDPTWKSYGASSEIISVLQKYIKNHDKYKLDRICYPDSHTPMSQILEKKFYINKNLIIKKLKKC